MLVVGHPSRAAVDTAADEAERVLGREVNIRVVAPSTWATGSDPFVRTVRDRPLVRLQLVGASS